MTKQTANEYVQCGVLIFQVAVSFVGVEEGWNKLLVKGTVDPKRNETLELKEEKM